MSQLFIVTTPQNSGDGTPLATAFNYTNSNFSELYARYQTTPPSTLVGTAGDQPGWYALDSNYFYYCFGDYDGSSVIWAQVAQVANIALPEIQNGTSNISIAGAGANATININGTSNVAVFSPAGEYVTGLISATGNVRGNYIFGNGSQLTGLPATYTDANVELLLASFGANPISTTGNITGGNLLTSGQISSTANITGNNIRTTNQVSAVGNIVTDSYFVGNFFGNITGNFTVPGSNTQVIFNTAGNADAVPGLTFNTAGPNLLTVLGTISSTGNVQAGNLRTAGQISATGAITTGGVVSATGNVSGGNLSGTNIVGTITTASQTNITAVGTLASLTVTANVQGGNLRTGGQISASGNIAGQNIRVTDVEAGGQVSATSYTGTSLSVTGNIIGGNLRSTGGVAVSGNISTAGNIVGGYLFGNASQLSGLPATYGNTNVALFLSNFGTNTISTTGTITSGSVAGGVITGVSANVTGNITGGNLILAAVGNITSPFGSNGNVTVNPDGTGQFIVTAITPATFGNTLTVSGDVTGGNLVTGGIVSATGNVNANAFYSAGAKMHNGISASGNIIGASLSVGNGTVTVGNIVTSGNAVGNIGSLDNQFNTVFALATSAQYADLAEVYAADTNYDPGTVVIFGGTEEITTTTQFADVRVAGAISTDPAYLMNSGATGLPVALRGRIPVKVIGSVNKGDLLVTAGNNPGYAISVGQNTDNPLAVFAKSIETNTNEGVKVITAVIL